MPTKRKKISALPLATSLKGLHVIGVDYENESVKVGLEFVGTAADNASKAATDANASKIAAASAASAANAAKTNADDATLAALVAKTDADKAARGADNAAKSANDAAESANHAAENVDAAIANALATERSERESGDQTMLSDANRYTEDRVARLVDSSPAVLDTLQELAAALGDDPNFATTVMNEIGKKVSKEEGKGLSTCDFTSPLKQKLDGLNPYDDADIRSLLDDLRTQLDTAVPRTLTPVAVTQTSLTIAGGNAYHYTGTAAITVSGAGAFSAVADSAVLTVPANVSVSFGAAFSLMDGLTTLTGSASQRKTYTILRVPVGVNTYALEVNGAIYGV